jgi:hypothetical protein
VARLYSAQLVSNEEWTGSAGPYTIPEGFVWVIRDLSIINYSLSVSEVTVYIGSGPVIYQNNDIPEGGWIHEVGRWVMLAGQQLLLQASQETGILISGYQLTTP